MALLRDYGFYLAVSKNICIFASRMKQKNNIEYESKRIG